VEYGLDLNERPVAVKIDRVARIDLGPKRRHEFRTSQEVEPGPSERLSGSITTSDNEIEDCAERRQTRARGCVGLPTGE
jgi:hypothetical protein